MLVDSSVWIDFLRGTGNAETNFLKESLDRGDSVWLAPPILQEVLQGADSLGRFNKWERVLGGLPLVQIGDIRGLTREAAMLYAACRWRAFTPRSANDCLIAVYAIRSQMPLLHRDRDFEQIAVIETSLLLLRLNRKSLL